MSDDIAIPAGECKYCTRPFQKKAFAKHQEFCSREHRLAWWGERKKRALEALAEAETAAAAKGGNVS